MDRGLRLHNHPEIFSETKFALSNNDPPEGPLFCSKKAGQLLVRRCRKHPPLILFQGRQAFSGAWS